MRILWMRKAWRIKNQGWFELWVNLPVWFFQSIYVCELYMCVVTDFQRHHMHIHTLVFFDVVIDEAQVKTECFGQVGKATNARTKVTNNTNKTNQKWKDPHKHKTTRQLTTCYYSIYLSLYFCCL